MVVASLKDFIQLVYTKYGHYMIIVIVLTIAIYVCPRIVMPQNFKLLTLMAMEKDSLISILEGSL